MPTAQPTGRTLSLALPAHCEDSIAATEKWLLSLWQASKKSNWSLWRGRATVALEYVAEAGEVRLQHYLASELLAEVSRALLSSHFPGIELAEESGSREGLDQNDYRASVDFRFRSPGWIDLPKDKDPDAQHGLLGALNGTDPDQFALVQFLLTPTWMTTEDGRQPAFWFIGRIVAAAPSLPACRSRLHLISASLGQFAGFNGFRVSPPRRLQPSDIDAIQERRWPRRLLAPGEPVTPFQVASLYHPPEEPTRVANLRSAPCLRTPTSALNEGIAVGTGIDLRGGKTEVRIRPPDLLRHGLVIGPSGSGKTTFLANLAVELARAGHGVSVIDPHGSLVRAVAAALPQERDGSALVFRFADREYPIAINPLRSRPGEEHLAADELIEILQRVQGREYWGPLLDLMLRHAALASIELGGSLIETARLLDDFWFRESVLTRLANPETVRFLGQIGEGATFDRRMLPAINRLQRFLATPWLRNILGQSRTGLDFGELFDQRSIALFDLSAIGGTNTRLLGSLLLLLIRQAALRRSPDGDQPLHFVLVDEASWFISKTVAELLDQARKFGVGLVLAVQRLGQLAPEETREAVLANTGSLLTYRISDREEATYLSRHLASERVGADDLQHLPRYEAYLQVTQDGDRLEPAWLRASAPATPRPDAAQAAARFLTAARERYARPRAQVEAELRERERLLSQEDEEPEVRSTALPPPAFPADAA